MTRPPSVDQLARSLSESELPHPLLVEVARDAIANDSVADAQALASRRARQMLTPVINATGVLLHTNLGRSPLGHEQSAGYLNLELDLASGKRGSRQRAVGDLLATAAGAEAALVVNNCAAAVMLVLAALAPNKGVAVSRGELVEIGGGFRIPDVMAASGANLIEVGTTNRTRLADFRRAVADNDAALAMHIHQSNYKIVGFTESVSVAALATLDVPVVADLGSGLLDASCPWLDGPPPAWLAEEPAVRQTLAAGADLVTFSGDKLFGGPQAGIIAGSRELVEQCGRHPLARALRPGGLVLAALQDTALHYLRRDGQAIEFWRMASSPIAELRARAEAVAATVGETVSTPPTVIDSEAVPGGGTLPGVAMPSIALSVPGDHLAALRSASRPIVARIAANTTVLDLRTVAASDDDTLAGALAAVISDKTVAEQTP